MLKHFFRLWVGEVTGLEKIPKYKPAVIISNHQSYFDFLGLTAVLSRDIRYLAAEKLFSHPTLGHLMKLTNQIKVDRDVPDKTNVIKEARRTLKDGLLLGIFPEGTRSRSGRIQKAFDGAVRIAIDMNVPIIPVGILGTFNILPPHRKLPTFSKCKFVIGDPIYIHHAYKYRYDKKLISNLTTFLMHEVAKLSDQKYIYGKRRPFTSFFDLKSHKKIVIFDLDNTLVQGQSQLHFINFLRSKKIIKNFSYFRLIIFFGLYKLHLIPLTDNLRNYLYSIFKNKSYPKYLGYVKEFVKYDLSKRIFPKAQDEIKKFNNQGYEIILCSTAWEPIVREIASILNIKHVIATKIQVTNSLITGKVSGSPAYGINKVKLVMTYCRKRNFNLKDSIGYADHATDIPLLELVDRPIAVNPDHGMIIEAKKRGWPILKWFNE